MQSKVKVLKLINSTANAIKRLRKMWQVFILVVVLYKLVDWLIRIPITGCPDGQRDYLLVTGCDTGFGNLFARRLDNKGFHVFASCLTEEGKKQLELNTSERLTAFIMDVTNTDSVQKAAKYVTEKLPPNQGLWAMLNNAGVDGPVGPTEWMLVEDFQRTLDVNFLGMIRATKAFLPLLKKSRGRVVNTSSQAGRIAMPGHSTYATSKYAVEAFSDSLRREMSAFGVSVHLVEPGFFRTPMNHPDRLRGILQKKWDKLTPELQEEYGEEFLSGLSQMVGSIIPLLASSKLDLVVDSYEHATLSWFPRARYQPGIDASLSQPLRLLPEWVSDLIINLAFIKTTVPTPASLCKKSLPSEK